jgi:lysophospholipase L1-like esterase
MGQKIDPDKRPAFPVNFPIGSKTVATIFGRTNHRLISADRLHFSAAGYKLPVKQVRPCLPK